MTGSASVAGIILAGGQARRMGGGDKALKPIAGRPMLDRVIDRLKPQVAALALNANGDPTRFSAYELPVVADSIADFAGPLAGVLAGMDWAGAHVPTARSVVTVAGDTPFFPEDLVERLMDAAGDSEETIALASSGGKTHPVFGLWPVALTDDLRAFLTAGETRKVLAWVDRHQRANVAFPEARAGALRFDPFFNINRPEDIEDAAKIAVALETLETVS